MSEYLTRDSILGAADLRTEEVPVPEWGGTVLVRGMTGSERDAYENALLKVTQGQTSVNLNNARARLVAYCVVGPDGKRLFSDADITALGRKSAAALDRVYAVAARLSGISAGDMAELTGEQEGLEAAPFDDSPTD